MLAILKSKKIKARLKGRGVDAPSRKPARYLNNMDSIWSLQSFLLSEADRCDVPIVTSENKEKAILQITRQVNLELAKHFTGTVRDVFGPIVEDLQAAAESKPWHELVGLSQQEISLTKKADKQDHQTFLHKKCILLIIDGLGDLPITDLDGKTPLEAAKTPVLDQLAGSGWYGQVDPIGPGEIPNTHSGTGMLMGLLPEQSKQLKRGPVEAFGAGCKLESGDIALRANFATIEPQDGVCLVTDRRAGRISNGTKELADSLTNIDLGDGISASLVSTDQHRAALVLKGPGLSDAISDTDPGDQSMPAALEDCRALEPGAEFTASKINLFVSTARNILARHPVNVARLSNGKPAANGVITRGAGSYIEIDNLLQLSGVKAAVVTGCNTVAGLGRLFGFTVMRDPRFTADLDTDIHAKITAAHSALKRSDMVFVHIKAPDICSHDQQPLAKRDFLQRLDKALAPLLNAGVTVAVCADHTTNSNTGAHSADPVPGLVYQPGSDIKAVAVKFGETACGNGNMERQPSHQFLSRTLRMMGFSLA